MKLPTSPIVSCQWLFEHLTHDKLVLLDASMDVVLGKEPIIYEHLICIPNSQKLPLEAEFFDLNAAQTHTMPTNEQYLTLIEKLGIAADSIVVIYDNQGIYSSPRAWWTFKLMGFEHVYVLDGGLVQWQHEGMPIANQYTEHHRKVSSDNVVVVHRHDDLVVNADFVVNVLTKPKHAVFDARAKNRFLGLAPEPRAGVRSGHIPGANNLPFLQVFDGVKLKSATELQALFASVVEASPDALGKDTQRIFSCGSGITACILILASMVSGHQKAALYDGSWAEWGSRHDLPIEK